MSASYTPGPWFCERHGIVAADVCGHRRQVASITGDAVMHADPTTDVITLQTANTRLIAAAPELLEALQRTLSLAEQWADGVGKSHPDWDVVNEAREAIRKATGGAP